MWETHWANVCVIWVVDFMATGQEKRHPHSNAAVLPQKIQRTQLGKVSKCRFVDGSSSDTLDQH